MHLYGKIIHELKLVDYLPIQMHKPYNNLHMSTSTQVNNCIIFLGTNKLLYFIKTSNILNIYIYISKVLDNTLKNNLSGKYTMIQENKWNKPSICWYKLLMFALNIWALLPYTVQSLYNNDLDIAKTKHGHVAAPYFLTMEYYIRKIVPLQSDLLITGSIPLDPINSIIKRLQLTMV